MLAGKLDRRVTIEKGGAADDGYNETEAWAPYVTVWAQFIPSAGKEAREQLGREAIMPASFRIRYSFDAALVEPGNYRLRYPAEPGGQLWDIKSVAEIDRRERLEIIAVARRGAA